MQLVLDYHLQNTKNPDKFINQIEFFVLGLIEIYNEKLLQDERLYEITQWILKNRVKGSSEYNSSKKHLVTIDSPPIDDRIDCNEDAEYITEYFMKLNDIIGADSLNPIMKKEDILHFLKANFKGFDPIEKIKKFDLNFKVENPFTYFIYEFYNYKISQQRRHHKKYYIDLLFSNFTIYETKVRDTVSKNFSRVPTKKLQEY
jgi:hypothetical protein